MRQQKNALTNVIQVAKMMTQPHPPSGGMSFTFFGVAFANGDGAFAFEPPFSPREFAILPSPARLHCQTSTADRLATMFAARRLDTRLLDQVLHTLPSDKRLRWKLRCFTALRRNPEWGNKIL